MKKILLILAVFVAVFSCDLGSDSSDKKDPVLYNIVFNGNGGEGALETISKKEGEKVTLPANVFTKSGFEFTGWNTAKDGTGTEYKDLASLTVGTTNITLYAQWKDLRFITVWNITRKDMILEFPLSKDGDYDFVIDWGDGSNKETITNITNNYIEHTYPDNKEYTVTVIGKLVGFGYIVNPNEPSTINDELTDIINWGNIQLHNEGFNFYGTKGFTKYSATDQLDISNLTRLSRMFAESSFNGDISLWDTSNITQMDGIFEGSEFNRDISGWDTSNVEYMSFMFFRASKFECGGIDISTWNWNVGKVIDMLSMFQSSPLDGKEPSWYDPSLTIF